MSRYGDWFRQERERERQAAGSGRRLDLAQIDAQAAQESRQLRSLAEVAEARAAQERQSQSRVGGSALASLAEEIAGGLDAAAQAGAARRSSRPQNLRREQQLIDRMQLAQMQKSQWDAGTWGVDSGTIRAGLETARNVYRGAPSGPTAGQRIAAGAKSIGHGLIGSVPYLAELAGQAGRNLREEAKDTELTRLKQQEQQIFDRMQLAQAEKSQWDVDADALRQRELALRAELGNVRGQAAPRQVLQKADPSGFGVRHMDAGAQELGKALEGMEGVQKFLGSTGYSMAQNAPSLGAGALVSAAAGGPVGAAVGLGMMSLQAAASRAHELSAEGYDPGTALARGLISGGIEAATERFSVESLWKIAEGAGAKTVIRNLLRQAGVEASEESASYALNYLADLAAHDPNATFSLPELAEQAAAGAVSGGAYGGIGLAANRLLGAQAPADSAVQTEGTAPSAQNALGEHGTRNYQYLKERDGGKTADFDAQYRHYYDLARSGLEDARIPQAASTSPMDSMAAQAAMIAGRNDGSAEATVTVQRLLDGEMVSDAEIDRSLSFPETRGSLEELVGALPPSASRARGAVREWQTRQTDAVRNPQPAADLTVRDNTSQGNPSPVSDLAARDSTEGGSAAGLAETEVSWKLKAEDREFLDTILQAVGLRGELVSETSDAVNAKIENGVVTVYANADDAAGAYRGTVRHEVTHQIKALGAEHYQAFEDFAVQARAARDGVSTDSLIASTRDFYRTQAGQELTAEQAREEISGDFAMLLDVDTDTVRQFVNRDAQNRQTAKGILQTIRDILSRIRERFANRKLSREQRAFLRNLQEGERLWAEALGEASQLVRNEKAARMDGEGAQYSIKRAADGSQFVEVDTDILEGVPRKDWVRTVKEYLKATFPDGVQVGNNIITINAQSRREMTYSEYTKWLRQNSSSLYADKLRATAFSDEILLASSDYVSEGLKHDRKDDIRDFARGTVQLRIGTRDYSADVVVGTKGNGQMLLYDIVNIQKKVDAPYSSGKSHAVDDGASADTSISDSEADVNGQFSLKNADAEIARQARIIDYLRGQMKRTKGLKADPKQLAALSKELLGEYSSKYGRAELTGELQALYDRYANAGGESFDALQRDARETARRILEQSSVLSSETAEDYRALRDYLKGTRLTLSEADRADVPGGYEDFRKANFGKLRLGADGVPVDTAYAELSADFGETLFPSDVTHPADQLAQIADVLDGLRPVYENPFSRDMEQAAGGLANDLIGRLFAVPQVPPTFADRQAARLEDAKAQGRERTREAVQREREKGRERLEKQALLEDWQREKALHRARQQRDARIEKLMRENRERVKKAVERERGTREKQLNALRERHRQANADRTDRLKRSELRRRIERHAGALSRKLLAPSDKQHIPESLRTTVASVLDCINLETAAQVDPATGKRSRWQMDPVTGKYRTRPVLDAEGNPVLGKNGKPKTEYVPMENGDPTKRTEAFRKLREEYHRIEQEDSEIVVDPDLAGKLEELEALSEKRLDEMGRDELQTVWEVLKAVETSVTEAGKLLQAGRFETIRELGDALAEEGEKRKRARKQFFGAADAVDTNLNIDMMAPYDYFHALGEGGDALYRELRQAFNRKVECQQEIQNFVGQLLDGVDTKGWSGKGAKTRTFVVSGGMLTMTPAQVMSLYRLAQRPQALEHLTKGGIRPTAIKKGVVEQTAGFPVTVTEGDILDITKTLTAEQRRVADKIGEFMSGTLSEWGNETSMRLYGYKKFREANYFPIQSDKNYVKAELGADGLDTRVKQKGWTKATVKGANNAVMVDDIFDVFAVHADEMGTYRTMLPALEDLSRVYNFKYLDGEGGVNGSVRDTLDRILGKHGQAYFRQLFNDLNGGINGGGGSKLLGSFKASAVGGNLRVIVQQPTAFFRAYAVMDAKYLAGGAFRKGDFREMVEHSPIARWKDWGYYQLDLGRTTKELLLNQPSAAQRVTEFFMKPAGAMDNLTWTRLWNACKLEIRDKRPGLEVGSDEYWAAVSERFDEVIDRTQVVDSVLHRSQMMRDTDGLRRLATSFMAEPTKTYNLMRTAAADVLRKRQGAGERFVRASAAMLLSSAATAAAAAVIDAMRGAGDDDDDRDFWERYREAAVGNFKDNVNPVGWHPYGNELFSLLQGYDAKRPDLALVSDVVKAFGTLLKAQSGEGKVTVEAALAEALLKVSKLAGLPIASIKRDVTAIVNTGLDAAQALGVNTYGVRFRWDMLRTAKNKDTASWWMEHAIAAKNGGDTETYERIVEMLEREELKTRKEVRDYEKNASGKDRNELAKLAYEAREGGDEEGFTAYTDALRAMGYGEDDIGEAMKRQEENERQDEYGFRTERSETSVRIQDEAYESDAYQELDKKQREQFENYLSAYSLSAAKEARYEDYDEDKKWVLYCRDAQKKCGLSESHFLIAKAAVSGVESLKDKDGKSITNSASLLKMQAIYDVPGLTQKQREYLFEACGVGKKVRHYNKARVEQEIRKMKQKAK